MRVNYVWSLHNPLVESTSWEWPHTCVGIKYVFDPFHALVASRERRHLLDSSWPQCWMMPASFSHGSEIATVVSCCLAWRFEMPLS